MTSVTIRIPEDVVEDLNRIAPLRGFAGYQTLIRAYIGQGLRNDLERLESETVTAFIASLKRRGVSDDIINQALSEVVISSPTASFVNICHRGRRGRRGKRRGKITPYRGFDSCSHRF